MLTASSESEEEESESDSDALPQPSRKQKKPAPKSNVLKDDDLYIPYRWISDVGGRVCYVFLFVLVVYYVRNRGAQASWGVRRARGGSFRVIP